jgi:golgi SNAP receptor complex member 2
MDINGSYKNLIQYKSDIDSLLHGIEGSSEPPSVAIQQRLGFLVNEFSKGVESMKVQVESMSDMKSRGMWVTRVSRFSEDLKMIRASCDQRLGLLFKGQKEKEERELLFGAGSQSSGQESDLITERMSLNSSNNMMDNMTEQSRVVLERLIGLNVTLKNARGKMFDVISSAGAGSSLANLINTREKADALIVYGCMVLTLVVFILVWWFVKK